MTKEQVIYLNRWLDCPDDIHRRNYAYQVRLNEAKAKFFYDLKEKGASQWQVTVCYQQFIHNNRDNLKLILSDQAL